MPVDFDLLVGVGDIYTFAKIAWAYGKIKKYQIVVSAVLFLNFPLSYSVLVFGMSPLATVFHHYAESWVTRDPSFFRKLCDKLRRIYVRHFVALRRVIR